VRRAAEAAVPGIVISAAEADRDGAPISYDLVGATAGRVYRVEVSAAGEVITIESSASDEGRP
jgi:hypothetical protein